MTRLFLALSVAFYHLPPRPFILLNAMVAVICFFIVSGFYMAMVLTEKYGDDLAGFYRARFWRLYPAYATMCVVMVLWFYWTNSPNAFTGPMAFAGQPAVTWPERLLHILLTFTVAGQDLFQMVASLKDATVRQFFTGDFFNSTWMLVGQAWSLGIEAFFYALAPFVVRSTRRTLIALVILLAIRALVVGVLPTQWPWAYFFTPATLCFFMLGASAYHLHKCFVSESRALIYILFPALIAGACIWLAQAESRQIDNLGNWLFYVCFASLVPFIFTATKDSRLDRRLGDLSYPLYLVHGLAQGAMIVHFPQAGPYAALAVAILSAVAMRFAVEIPVQLLRTQRLTSLRAAIDNRV